MVFKEWQYTPVMKDGTMPVSDHRSHKKDRLVQDFDERKVHHRDGSTSTKYQVNIDSRYYFKGTYQQWLKSQLKTDPGFVKDVLGDTRFKLFKAGKLSLASMA